MTQHKGAKSWFEQLRDANTYYMDHIRTWSPIEVMKSRRGKRNPETLRGMNQVIEFLGTFHSIASRVGFEILDSLPILIFLFMAVSRPAPDAFRMSNDCRVNKECTLLWTSLHFMNYKNMNKPKAEDNPWIMKPQKTNDADQKRTPSHKKMGCKQGRKEKNDHNTVRNKNGMNHEIDEKISRYPDTFYSLVWNIVTKQ